MKTALVTGSASGIGFQVGLDLLVKDYYVYFNDRTKQSLFNIAADLKPYTESYEFIQADLSKMEEIQKITNKIHNIDVLILNAGMTDRTPFSNVKEKNWDSVFNTNLKVPFFSVQALKNRINKGGRIIFISSISGCTTDSTSITYGVSKGAIHHLVPYLAKEFAYKQITVNAIAPGYISTNWHLGKSPEQIKRITQKCLAKRLGTTQEISKAVMALIDNDFINAQILRIDGGFLV